MNNTLETKTNIVIKTLFDFNKMQKNAYSIICNFKCERLPSLQQYIIDEAMRDDENHIAKTYIVFDSVSRIIIGYFSLRANSLVHHFYEKDDVEANMASTDEGKLVRSIIPCVEIEKFALNDVFLKELIKVNCKKNGMGQYIFRKYISSILIYISKSIGYHYVILFAYNHQKVLAAYGEMGFQTIEEDDMNLFSTMKDITLFVDCFSKNCKFMYQTLEDIIQVYEGGC